LGAKENFMYDEKGSNHLKLIDFGFSKAWDPEKNKKL
jgi:serine/threonine protein kinase